MRELTAALREIALAEKLTLACHEQTLAEMIRRQDPRVTFRGQGLAHHRYRLARVEDAAELLWILERHEAAVRALDPALAIASLGQGDVPLG